MNIQYVTGDATDPARGRPGVIVHVCNDIGSWGRGFVMAVSGRWKEPELRYRAWYRGQDEQPFELGQVQFVQVEETLWVANLIGQRDIRRRGGTPPVRYDAIRSGLKQVAAFAETSRAVVHMPRIGCGLAGGSWEEIAPIIQQELSDQGIPVVVYDVVAEVDSAT